LLTVADAPTIGTDASDVREFGRTGTMKIPRGVPAWRSWFLIALAAFLLTRGLTLMVFPIFNDEANSLQYSQAIHDDWQKNRFISMSGEWGDWKPPLQYWLAVPVIQWGSDPLLAGRAVAWLVSLLGLAGFYLFAKEFFGPREAVMTALLYTVCPTVLFYNNQFIAETFLFSTTPFFYWALLKMMRSKRWKLPWAILGTAIGMAVLLFKQSGSLLLAMGIVLPLAQLRKKEPTPAKAHETTGEAQAAAHGNWKEFAVHCLCVALVIGFAHAAAQLVTPAAFDSTRENFNSRWVMSPRELFHFPMEAWRTNLRVVAEYAGSYYSWAVPLFFCGFTGFAFRRKNLPELALAIMCLAGGGAVIFLLRGFNEYLFNTAIIAVLLPLLARTGLLVWDMTRNGKAGRVRAGLLICAGIVACHWGYQLALMSCSPGKYIERSTSWALGNYLKAWPTGFGVKEVVALLEKEKRPGILFVDPQWGNPQTALRIYGPTRFPNLRIVPISMEFLDPSETRKLRDDARQMGQVRFAIFSADTSDGRDQWQRTIEQQMCDTRQEIRAYPAQIPIIVCGF
jgi:Dolichyl-phosphate-mannose-protein mannosyltransferase